MIGKHIPELTAQTMFLFYISVKNAEMYAQAICDDPGTDPELKNNLFRPLLNKMRVSKQAIERGVQGQSKEAFELLLKNNDLLVYDEIKRIMMLMRPEQQQKFETVARSIITGEEMTIEIKPL